jgi:hypothetical protein
MHFIDTEAFENAKQWTLREMERRHCDVAHCTKEKRLQVPYQVVGQLDDKPLRRFSRDSIPPGNQPIHVRFVLCQEFMMPSTFLLCAMFLLGA